jgi:hypothetical protein
MDKSRRKSPIKKQSASTIKIIEEVEQEKLQKSLSSSEKYCDNALEETLKNKNIKERINFLDIILEKKR